MDIITVAVPIYNAEKYLNYCIESIIKQTYKNLQILLINDGSTDDSLKICKKFAAIDKRIKIISKKNGGVGSARNVALRNATGSYITFVDSDDYIDVDYVYKMYHLCKKNECDISMVGFKEVKDYIDIRSNNNDKDYVDVLTNYEILNNLFTNKDISYIVPWCKLYKLELFTRNNIFYPENVIADDEGTTYKLFYYANKIAISNEKLYYYVYREGSLSKSTFTVENLKTLEIFLERYKFFEKSSNDFFKVLSFKYYIKILIDYYCLSKINLKNNPTYKTIINNLSQEIKKNCYLINKKHSKNLTFIEKMKYKINCISPNIYFLIYIIKHII